MDMSLLKSVQTDTSPVRTSYIACLFYNCTVKKKACVTFVPSGTPYGVKLRQIFCVCFMPNWVCFHTNSVCFPTNFSVFSHSL